MKRKIGLAVVITLFLVGSAFADTTFDISGFNNADASAFWSGMFSVGTSGNVTSFFVDPPLCSSCSPTLPAWTFSSLVFDGTTSDLSGTASANFNNLGTGVHFLTLTFNDGNNTSDPWSDLNKFGGIKTGTFSYCLGAGCTNPNAPPGPVPEPPSIFLLAIGLAGLMGMGLCKKRLA